ncbi:phytanoyl-CoA dioxygenase family protein [Parasulfitobacter algicola]|uniref:Phytanoyl-CoA dioxygenase family protein n=1 Tax=Parasulfitobacter algicola TaxID=2614809 RepID=A0ABX2IP51_9RHOB|nr:phytanoyl-CoA dioxygenase family protein [Sulfitobacter algicola]NSX54648.1 phytanoyl-CoA dioxygenase family protein [Sulfitobacter algicola]
MKNELQENGCVWIRRALDERALSRFDAACDLGAKPGARLQLDRDVTADLDSLIAAILPKSRPVRLVSFNKTADSNWAVPWHQDRVIVVREKHDVEGFENWSQKSGVWHCEPPVDVLENMLFVRVHLDAADAENGAMQIALGSHKEGRVTSEMAAKIADRYPVETCVAQRGDVLILQMLTLHRSLPSQSKSDRRTFRIDYAACDLSYPLTWVSA